MTKPGWQDDKTLKLPADDEQQTLHVTERVTAPDAPHTPARTETPGHFGPYRIIEPIGKGELGVVYRVRDVVLGRDCALKVFAPAQASEATIRWRASWP